jgi:hypothetical protein
MCSKPLCNIIKVDKSDFHQYLSPSENKLQGSKSTWQERYKVANQPGKSATILSTFLQLMQLFDLDTTKKSKNYFATHYKMQYSV